jgi:hypothetical protein
MSHLVRIVRLVRTNLHGQPSLWAANKPEEGKYPVRMVAAAHPWLSKVTFNAYDAFDAHFLAIITRRLVRGPENKI